MNVLIFVGWASFCSCNSDKTWLAETTRLNAYDATGIVTILQSYFANLEAGGDHWGGAVAGYATEFIIEETTFLRCHAVHSGAIYLLTEKLTHSKCCASECWASTNGQYALIQSVGAPVIVIAQETTIFKCGVGQTGSEASFLTDDTACALSGLNFTFTQVHGAGAAFLHSNEKELKFHYVTVLKCTGSTIFSKSSGPAEVQYAQFYDNHPTSGVIQYHEGQPTTVPVELSLSHCIFARNAVADFTSATRIKSLVQCVFSGPAPANCQEKEGVQQGTTTATFNTPILISFHCLELPRTVASPSSRFEFSAGIDKSHNFAPSSLSSSQKFIKSSGFEASQLFRKSEPLRTAVSRSVPMPKSTVFKESDVFGRSSSFTRSRGKDSQRDGGGSKPPRGQELGLILGTAFALLLLVCLGVGFGLYLRKLAKSGENEGRTELASDADDPTADFLRQQMIEEEHELSLDFTNPVFDGKPIMDKDFDRDSDELL
jgi:hypothetical protein